jgi:beta-N-acetylhexosaminidase
MSAVDLRRAASHTLLTSFRGSTVPPWLLRRVEQGAGGVCLYGSNRDADFGAVCAQLRQARQDVVLACDEEGGDVTRLEMNTGSSVPGNAALGAIDDVDLTRSVATSLGQLLRQTGFDLDLAPCADVNSDPANPVIGVRAFGADAHLVARHTVAFIEGLHHAGIAACAKHFPGHGAVDVDSHRDLPRLDATAALLDARELVPFRAAIAAGVDAVMPGHLLVPSLDAEPATTSKAIIGGMLRGLGFPGAVVTDGLDMGGIGGPSAIPANVVAALVAGADLCCLGPDNDEGLFDACVQAIVDAVTANRLPEARVLEAGAHSAGLRRSPTRRPSETDLRSLGMAAAAAALRVSGTLPKALAGAHVLELDRPQNPAAGTVPWGVGEHLQRHDPTVTVTRIAADDQGWLAAEASIGSLLVLVVRDAHRLPAPATAVESVLSLRADVVLVDMGWPADDGVAAGGGATPIATVVTHGASRASGEAVAALLARRSAVLTPSIERMPNG